MMISEKLSEFLAVVAVAPPIVLADTEKYCPDAGAGAGLIYIDMSKWEQVIFIFQTGNVNNKTFDFRVYEARDAAGTGVQLLTGYAATQLAAHATDNDNKQSVISVRREALTKATATVAAYTHIRAGMLSQAAQDGPVGILALGANAAYQDAAGYDVATCVEIID